MSHCFLVDACYTRGAFKDKRNTMRLSDWHGEKTYYVVGNSSQGHEDIRHHI